MFYDHIKKRKLKIHIVGYEKHIKVGLLAGSVHQLMNGKHNFPGEKKVNKR